MSGRRLRSDAVAVSGGRATKAAPVNGRKDLWTLTVRPDSLAEVTVTLAAGAACDTPAAVCTADGRALSGTVSTTVRGPVALSVADARAREGKDPTLDFAVSLSRASSGRVTVDYATVDGSAKAGADYEATSGTLSFAPGETAKTVAVPVLDDAHDEGTEVLVLRLENARGARLGVRLTVGRIENTGPHAGGVAGALRAHGDRPGARRGGGAPGGAARGGYAGAACRPGAAVLGRRRGREDGREPRIGVRGRRQRVGARAGGAGPRRDDGDPRLDGAGRRGRRLARRR